MAITTKQIKELRDATGAGMMDCKEALIKADGNFDGAVDFLREKGLAKARALTIEGFHYDNLLKMAQVCREETIP